MHTVVRKNTERSLIHFAQIPPMATSCKTVVLHHNQIIDMIQSTTLIQIVPHLNFTNLMCVCARMHALINIQFYHPCRFMYLLPQSRYRTVPTHKASLSCPVITTPTSLCPPLPNPWPPLIHPPFLEFCHSKKVI